MLVPRLVLRYSLSQGCEWTLSLEPFLKTKFALIDQLSARVILLIQYLLFQENMLQKQIVGYIYVLDAIKSCLSFTPALANTH